MKVTRDSNFFIIRKVKQFVFKLYKKIKLYQKHLRKKVLHNINMQSEW